MVTEHFALRPANFAMPGRKAYDLSLGEKFPGGRKNWESFNGIIINKMMDNGLAIFMDIAICLHTYMQWSLQASQPATPEGAGRSNLSTPGTKTKRRLANEMRRLATDGIEPEVRSSESTAESAPSGQRAPEERPPTIDHPLLPEHLTDPSYAAHWEFACSKGDIDYLNDLEMESCYLLVDNKKDWNDMKAMQATDDDHLKRRQVSLLAQIFRTIVRQFINAMVTAFIRPGENSPEQDALMAILLSKEKKDVALGKVFDAEWVKKPWLMPIVRVYVQLLHHFENLKEQSTVNIVQELMEVLKSATTSSVTDIGLKFDKVIDPVARTFTTVDSFIDYFKASLQLEVIRQRTKLKGARGRAWRKAYDHLCAAITRGQRLDLQLISDSVKLSDAHLRDAGLSGIDPDEPPAQAATATTAAADPTTPTTPGKKKKSWKELRTVMAAKVKTLEAQLAEKPDSRRPQTPKGGSGAAPGRTDAPVCKTCGDSHHGKCLKDSVKEQRERLAADEAKLKKQQDWHCKKREEAAAQSARAVPAVEDFDSDSNEESDFYPTACDWNPDLLPTDVTITSQRVCLSAHLGDDGNGLAKPLPPPSPSTSPTSRACVDTGAQLSMSPNPTHVLEYLDGTTRVQGIQVEARTCPNVRLGIPTVTKDGEPILLEVPTPSILHEDAHGLLLAHGPMKRAGFDVKFREGTKHNPRDGGYIRLPDGRVVLLDFDEDLYYLPVHTPVGAKHAAPACQARSAAALRPSSNPFQLLQGDSSDPTPPGRICQ